MCHETLAIVFFFYSQHGHEMHHSLLMCYQVTMQELLVIWTIVIYKANLIK